MLYFGYNMGFSFSVISSNSIVGYQLSVYATN